MVTLERTAQFLTIVAQLLITESLNSSTWNASTRTPRLIDESRLIVQDSIAWPGLLARTANFTYLPTLLSTEEVAAIRQAIPSNSVWDEDLDSVDEMATFEFVIERYNAQGGLRTVPGKPDNNPRIFDQREPTRQRLQQLMRPIISERITPLVNKMILSCEGRCRACHSIVRRYLDGERRGHAAHFDIQALSTVVVSLNEEYEGGIYVTTGQVRQLIPLRAGDGLMHESDLLHEVDVQRGRRWSWILWFVDSSSCSAEPGQWHLAEAYAGDPIAMFLHAKRAHLSRHYSANATAEKARWLLAAAQSNFSRAQNELGMAYKLGEGFAQDLSKARVWFEKAAPFERDAIYNLGMMEIERGNIPAAVRWFQEAAEQGSPHAMHNMGVAHIKGAGVPKDLDKAAFWLERCGDAEAMYKLSALFREATPSRAANYTAARWWLERAAQAGHKVACRNMGEMAIRARLSFGIVERWLRKAIGAGDDHAHKLLQHIYQQKKESGTREL